MTLPLFSHKLLRSLLSCAATDPEPLHWYHFYPEALAEARQSGKPIFLPLTVGWTVDYRESVSEDSDGSSFPYAAGKDSYVLHHAYASWDCPAVEDLNIALNIDNVFDEDYQDHTIFSGSGLASPGRKIRLTASIKY